MDKNNGLLLVHSGDCCLCEIGIPAKAKSVDGKDLHTGDIVMLSHGMYVGTDDEMWTLDPCLTAVVNNQMQSFADGSVKVEALDAEPYVMGIKNCRFNHPEWQIHMVKPYTHVVEGEHWTAYGFSYRRNEAAEAALLRAREQ